jgi:hypothetical protein
MGSSECLEGHTLACALRAAEAELHELALELRRLPPDEGTLGLHRAALGLKRDLSRWHTERPAQAAVSAALERIGQMRREAVQRGSPRRCSGSWVPGA